MFCYDLWCKLFQNLSIRSKIVLKNINLTAYHLRIINLYDVNRSILDCLNDRILRLEIFRQIKQLNATVNDQITNISHLHCLKKLSARKNCGIKQHSIEFLNLTE